MEDMRTNRSLRILVALIVAVSAAALATLSYLLPVTGDDANLLAVHSRAAVAIAIVILYFGGAVIFLRGLGSFQAKFRTAYRLIGISLLLFTLTLVQLVIWGLLDLWDSLWATSGIAMVPYLLAAIIVYLGIRKMGQALAIHGRLMSIRFVSFMSLVTAVLSYIAAANWVQYKLEGVESYIAITLCGASYAFCTVLLTYRLYRAMGDYYHRSMKWLVIAMVGIFINYAHEGINTFWFTNGDAYTDYGFYLLPVALGGSLLLRAAYEFSLLPLLGSTAHRTARSEALTTKDYVDSIVNVAALVSRKEDIIEAMDGLRIVTARLGQQGKLSAHDQDLLLQTYHKLEQYLIEKDAVRRLDKDQVRTYVTPAFLSLLQRHETHPATAA